MDLDPQSVADLVQRGKYKTCKPLGRSRAWKSCRWVVDEKGKRLNGLVYCEECRRCFVYKGHYTSNLLRHKCTQSPSTAPMTLPDQEDVARVLASWLVRDARPVTAVSGPGFEKLLQFFIHVGAQHGEIVNVRSILPSPEILRQQIDSMAERTRNLLRRDLAELPPPQVVVALDMWRDRHVRQDLMAVNVHWLKDGRMKHLTLGLRSLPHDNPSAEYLLHTLRDIFREYDIKDISGYVYVSDPENPINDELVDCTRLECTSHVMEFVVAASFEATRELKFTLDGCRDLVRFIEQNKLTGHLGTPLKGEGSTRWNSTFAMIESLVLQWAGVEEVLQSRRQAKRFALIDVDTLRGLAEVGRTFALLFHQFQDTTKPTLSFVVPATFKLKAQCARRSEDPTPLAAFKANICRHIDDIWMPCLSMQHKAAFLLYPAMVEMRSQLDDLDEVKRFIVSNMGDYPDIQRQEERPSSPRVDPVGGAKKDAANPSQLDLFFFPDLLKPPSKRAETRDEELNRYCRENVTMPGLDFNVIDWWQEQSHRYPRLAAYALKLLWIPASSAAVEQVYAVTSNVMAERMQALGTNTDDSIVFLNMYNRNMSH